MSKTGELRNIIVADEYTGSFASRKAKVFDFDKEGVIHRDAYNIIHVSMVKGLEFEKVIVITKGMTENQKYVACTRAIKELQVVD